MSANSKLAIGLMSGTSADGIDAALVELRGDGDSVRYHLRAFATYRYPVGFKKFLLKSSSLSKSRIDDLTLASMLIAHFFADAARRIARRGKVSLRDVDFIGSHGQTVYHLPDTHRLFGKSVHSSLQIGHPSAIAKLTGVLTVGDFRIGDLAIGGNGAPLVPLFDYLTLRSRSHSVASLNIGGIANVTILPRNCSRDEIIAFDTGPGNMVIDSLAARYFHVPCDRGGRIAKSGKLLPGVLQWMMSHPYLKKRPPKTTGRETFGDAFVRRLIQRSGKASPADLITTSTEYSALCIYDSYLRFIRPRHQLTTMFVGGGGVHNAYLMEALRRYFERTTILSTDEAGIPPDAKEAICFALLANETLAGHPGNIPSATGATKRTVLGVIAPP